MEKGKEVKEEEKEEIAEEKKVELDERNEEDDVEADFDCPICLSTVRDPVITLCGHMFCWACIYQSLQIKQECPVCKGSVSEDSLVPLYGRGKAKKGKTGANNIPERPKRKHTPSEASTNQGARHFGASVSVSSNILFGPSVQISMGGGNIAPMTPLEREQQKKIAIAAFFIAILAMIIIVLMG